MPCKHKILSYSLLLTYTRRLSRTYTDTPIHIHSYIHIGNFCPFSRAGHILFSQPACAWAIKLLEFSWTENSLWRKSLSGSVYSSRNMKNRSARPWAQSQYPDPHTVPPAPLLHALFLASFLRDFYRRIMVFICRSTCDPLCSSSIRQLTYFFFVGKFNYFKMICAHINTKK